MYMNFELSKFVCYAELNSKNTGNKSYAYVYVAALRRPLTACQTNSTCNFTNNGTSVPSIT